MPKVHYLVIRILIKHPVAFIYDEPLPDFPFPVFTDAVPLEKA
jgi:hypothetical protein